MEESTGIPSPARSWTAGTINRRIGSFPRWPVTNSVPTWHGKRAVAEFTASDSPEGVAATLAGFWLANNTEPTKPSAGVASDKDIRAVAKRWKLNLPERTINLAVAEVSRIPSDPVGRFKGFLTYG